MLGHCHFDLLGQPREYLGPCGCVIQLADGVNECILRLRV